MFAFTITVAININNISTVAARRKTMKVMRKLPLQLPDKQQSTFFALSRVVHANSQWIFWIAGKFFIYWLKLCKERSAYMKANNIHRVLDKKNQISQENLQKVFQFVFYTIQLSLWSQTLSASSSREIHSTRQCSAHYYCFIFSFYALNLVPAFCFSLQFFGLSCFASGGRDVNTNFLLTFFLFKTPKKLFQLRPNWSAFHF